MDTKSLILFKNFWYSISFLELEFSDEYEDLINHLREQEIIWGVVQFTNIFFVASNLDIINLKTVIYNRIEVKVSLIITKIDPSYFIHQSNTQIYLAEDFITTISDDNSIITVPKTNKIPSEKSIKKTSYKKKSRKEDINWEQDHETITNQILEKISKKGMSSLTEKEKSFLEKL